MGQAETINRGRYSCSHLLSPMLGVDVGLGGVVCWTRWIKMIIQACLVLSVCGLNIAMQPFQSGTRAFVIDSCPANQQAQASEWCSQFNGLGGVITHIVGFAAFRECAAHPGADFKLLSCIGTFLLILMIIACTIILEKPIEVDGVDDDITAWAIMSGLWSTFKKLPPTTRKVYKIQYFSWLAWFPVLYYTTTYENPSYTCMATSTNSEGSYTYQIRK